MKKTLDLMGSNRSFKTLFSSDFRRYLKVIKTGVLDRLSGQRWRFVKQKIMTVEEQQDFKEQIKIVQRVKKTSYFENKRHNLATAIAQIENILIPPGEIFSFWYLVGEPSIKNGYREGRAIVNNQLKSDVGGGLCQLSGLIYYLILKAGLIPLERYPHSQDIYTEETRFAPLGSDATVVYGYKDLRFKNNLSIPICFRFYLFEEEIIGCLCSSETLEEFNIEFRIEAQQELKKVDTIRWVKTRDQLTLITSNFYPSLIAKD
ncbi:VanW-like protein (modular protein) [Planktothrix sp. PCC 11201]|uniref:VanW family protein n=1 Tax=Planktothrix sp. PCC 11201 TaxID=1729650 RepID=UPI00091164DB|nr:VanW family protein [Planktothrix sp. PCC 11201]SKB13265.1 VanW-like protein (modular protein) [Planktothrix sp. PCC 11201]